MARHVCPECGATVTGDEQFCPTCGTFLGYEEEHNHEDYEQFELGAAPPPSADPGPTRRNSMTCPSCGTENAPGNRHCEECGARLAQGPLPTAPRPAVQATAGVRAVIAIGGLLLGVIIIALLVQVFGGESGSDTTIPSAESSVPSTAAPVEPAKIDPLDVECSVEGVGSFVCNNLITGTDGLYQINWPDLEAEGGTLTITVRFRTATAISQILWKNITDDEVRFQRNYRVRSLTISADDSLVAIPAELQNVPGVQRIDFTSLNTNQVTFEIDSVWDAELIDGNVFTELAIDEIEIVGRPPTDVTPTETTSTTDTTQP